MFLRERLSLKPTDITFVQGCHNGDQKLLTHVVFNSDPPALLLPCYSATIMTSKSQIMRQSLHIHIDPSPYVSGLVISPKSASPSSESTHFSTGTSRTTPTSTGSDQDEFSVLCIYDFRAADDDQLSFRKNEILLIVKRENTGWWAAMRRGGDTIGWIPQAFVNTLTEEMAERLANVKEDLRFYVYQAEQLWEPEVESAPRGRVCHLSVDSSFCFMSSIGVP